MKSRKLKLSPLETQFACYHCSTSVMDTDGGERKKGIATINLLDGSYHLAEIHWYEAHGIGKRDLKIKFPFLD